MSKTDLVPQEVAELVERYLEKYQPAEYRILIDAAGVKQDEDGWWEVPSSRQKTMCLLTIGLVEVPKPPVKWMSPKVCMFYLCEWL